MNGYLEPDPNSAIPNVYYPPDEINKNDPRELWIVMHQQLTPIAKQDPLTAERIYQAAKPELEQRTNVKFPHGMFVDMTR